MKKQNPEQILIFNARVLKENRIIKNAWVLINKNKIQAIGTGKKNITNAVKINAKNNFLAPGFIDLHIHGNIKKISAQQAKSGTTGFLLGLHTDKISSFKAKIKSAQQKVLKGAECLGFHFEGPFINPDMAGAQPGKNILAPGKKNINEFLKNLPSGIKIISLACELKGAFNLIKKLKQNKIIAALGHTNASIEQAEKSVDLGINYAIHTFNRMSSVSSRNPGVVTQVLLDDRVYAEIIADGYHVHPALIRLLVKNKPRDKIVLITDSVNAMEGLNLKKIKGVYCTQTHTIAGSNLTMLDAVKNMMQYTGISINDAVKMASFNPATVIGVNKKKGKIKNNFDADFVMFDDNFKCKMTMISGKIVYNNI
ncbi:MAG: N-acetylglucosamine-6-phosphate deacetylase [Candidatus Omnitrophota bacterium]